MSRVSGDTNYSDREKRLRIEKEELKAKNKVLNATIKSRDARLKEFREEIKKLKRA